MSFYLHGSAQESRRFGTSQIRSVLFLPKLGAKAPFSNQTDDLSGSHFSSESPHPSPKSTFPSLRARRLRQPLVERSILAPAGTIPKLRVPTIANLKTRQQPKSAEGSDDISAGPRNRQKYFAATFPRRQRSSSRVGAEPKKSSVSSVTHRLRGHLRRSFSDIRIPEYRIANSAKDLFPPRKERAGYEWTNTSKKDDWVEHLISTSGVTQRRAKSADPSPFPIIPLRPPASRTMSGTGYQHTVRLETSFVNPRPVTPLETPKHPRKNSKPSIAKRTKSIIARRVRFALYRSTSAASSSNQKTSPSTPLKTSLLSARNRTAEGLQRVASIPNFMVAEIPSRTTSDRSNQSCEAILPTPLKRSPRKGAFHLPAVIPQPRAKIHNALQHILYQMDATRRHSLNTPDPKETYRIKRRPSAEAEEFFKINISIRGGTKLPPQRGNQNQHSTPPRRWTGREACRFLLRLRRPFCTRDSTYGKSTWR